MNSRNTFAIGTGILVIALAACGGQALGRDAGASGGGSDGGGVGEEENAGEGAGTTAATGEGGGTSEGATEGGFGTGDASGGIVCDAQDEVHLLHGVPPSVMLVLDKSGSMAWIWDHDVDPSTADVSKWSSLYHVVEYVVAGDGESMLFGAQLFPAIEASGAGADACIVDPDSPEVGVAPGNGAAILAAIPGPDAVVHGGTPASKGFASAIDHLLALDPTSPKYVVLVTDGAANCKDGETGTNLNLVYDDTFPGLVAAARGDHGILTYAIGIDIVNEQIPAPQTNPWESINAVAAAGGAPLAGGEQVFYAANNEIELASAMQSITGHIDCTVALDVEPDFPDLVTVDLDGVPIARATDCETEDGWIYTSEQAPFTAIELCGSACDQHTLTAEVAIHMACA